VCLLCVVPLTDTCSTSHHVWLALFWCLDIQGGLVSVVSWACVHMYSLYTAPMGVIASYGPGKGTVYCVSLPLFQRVLRAAGAQLCVCLCVTLC
jgi:hypothetical protein